MKPSAATANKFIAALGTLNNEPALNLAAEYMNVKANDLAAAHAVADLIEKNEALQRGAHIRDMLLKAQNVFKSHTENADAGYAVDQVNTILPKIVDDPECRHGQGRQALGGRREGRLRNALRRHRPR